MVLIASTVPSFSLTHKRGHSNSVSMTLVSFSLLLLSEVRGFRNEFSKKKLRVSQQYKTKDGGFGGLISYLSQINTERERESEEERGKESCRSHSSLVFTSSFSFFSPPIMSFYIYFFNLLILLLFHTIFSYLYPLLINCTHNNYSSTPMTILTLSYIYC